MTLPPVPLRVLALFCAALQLASPGFSAIAHAQISAQDFSGVAHVEATTGAKCPAVHSPECGMCRYLSQGARLEPVPAVILSISARGVTAQNRGLVVRNAARTLPHGRAPPVS